MLRGGARSLPLRVKDQWGAACSPSCVLNPHAPHEGTRPEASGIPHPTSSPRSPRNQPPASRAVQDKASLHKPAVGSPRPRVERPEEKVAFARRLGSPRQQHHRERRGELPGVQTVPRSWHLPAAPPLPLATEPAAPELPGRPTRVGRLRRTPAARDSAGQECAPWPRREGPASASPLLTPSRQGRPMVLPLPSEASPQGLWPGRGSSHGKGPQGPG